MLLQRRSLGNRVVCFCGVKRLWAFGSTRSWGAGDRTTVTTGGDRSIDGYDGPLTCRDYSVDGSHNGGRESQWHHQQWESMEVVRWSYLPKSLYRLVNWFWVSWFILSLTLSIVMDKFSSELWFKPEPPRTEPEVQFEVLKNGWTKPQVWFRVQQLRPQFEPIRTASV